MQADTIAEHTPRPWKQIIGNGGGDHWNIHQQTETIDGGFFCRVDALHFTKEARETARANAALIAAAPDLLAALEGVQTYLATFGDPKSGTQRRCLTIVAQAIAKAKGGA